MYSSNDILQFLDGSLSAEREAELLHRLSVSPERRDVLRGYMNQNVLFQRDREAIAVPYAAEQKLWAKLGEVMPPVLSRTASESAAPIVSQIVRKPVSSWVTVALTGAIALFIGFGSGFFSGKNYESVNTFASATPKDISSQFASTNGTNLAPTSGVSNNVTATTHQNVKHFIRDRQSGAPRMSTDAAQLNSGVIHEISSNDISSGSVSLSSKEESAITPSRIRPMETEVDPVQVIDDPERYTMNPFAMEKTREKTFWERTEFQFTESFGKQYPDNAATRVSFPVVTNSSISAFHEPFQSVNLWFGLGFGTGNISKKSLRQHNDYDPSFFEIKADVAHVQASWIGGFAQYRFPIVGNFDITTTLGLSGSTVGLMSSAEIGSHFLVTQQVGLALGFRITNLSYTLDNDINAMVSKYPNATGYSGLQGTQNSQNYDITAGIFFHF
jgi:hypothetical protein